MSKDGKDDLFAFFALLAWWIGWGVAEGFYSPMSVIGLVGVIVSVWMKVPELGSLLAKVLLLPLVIALIIMGDLFISTWKGLFKCEVLLV
jgi:hypothetical protein